jgi:glycosyltransferase involved in cell wall biosynthesis
MGTAAFVSFRLGVNDGVSVVARNWQRAFEQLGYAVHTVAGDGPVDRTVPGLAIDATDPPTAVDVADAIGDVDVVVVENLCTIPLNLPAARVVAEVLAGRPAVMHHHDPPWQREKWAHVTELPPRDPAWRHVTINELTRREMADRGYDARCIYNGFPVATGGADRTGVRSRLGVDDDTLLLAHPVRAIPRKEIPTAVRLAEQLGGTYWLWGPAEDGYDDELARILGSATCPVVRGTSGESAVDLYGACDAVLFPSTWEGFGNPPVEAAIHRVPCAVGPYPVADELRAMGLEWYPSDDPEPLRQAIAHPDRDRLERNRRIAVERLSLDAMRDEIAALLAEPGFLDPGRGSTPVQ